MTLLFIKRLVALCFITCALTLGSFAQPMVGLDNWYNRETNAKTGKKFHYTWNDEAMSGFSQLGDLFVKRGATLKATNNLVVLLLKKVKGQGERRNNGLT